MCEKLNVRMRWRASRVIAFVLHDLKIASNGIQYT